MLCSEEVAVSVTGGPLPGIPREYRDLVDVFSKGASDELPPHRTTDCAIEILLGGKLPKPKCTLL